MIMQTHYESFPNKTLYHEPPECLNFNESASNEAQSWLKLFQTIPVGVQTRRQQEEEQTRIRLEEKRRQEELDMRNNESESWMPDEVCRVCYRCQEPFTVFRRRHHCRMCGLIFCGSCSSRFINGLSCGLADELVRVCEECYDNSTKLIKSQSDFLIQRRSSQNIPLAEANEIKLGDDDISDEQESVTTTSQRDQAESDVSFPEETLDSVRMMEKTKRQVKRDKIKFTTSNEDSSILSAAPSKVFEIREANLLRSLFPEEYSEEWKNIFLSLCKDVCESLRPDPTISGDDLDVCKYLRVQILPGSTPLSSFKVNGAVLRKNIIDRFMPNVVNNPRIMLLESGIELDRDQSKFLSFETIIEQELLYVRLLVKKIIALKVNVLLVGGTVSGLARDLLGKHGVAVSSLVSHEDLHWISRLTGAIIIPKTESINRIVDPTGTCAQWRCETISIVYPKEEEESIIQGEFLPPRQRSDPEHDTFMLFDGCIPGKGCTICLRGESWISLRQRSIFFEYIVRKLWTLKLDHSLITCMDGEEQIVSDTFNFFGNYFRDEADVIMIKAEKIELGRVWLQGSTQSSVPETTTRSFYGPKDHSFGEFLLRYCFDQKKAINNMADGNYSLVFLHGHGRIRFSSERLAKSDANDYQSLKIGLEEDENIRILTWGACKICGEQTNVRCLSKFVMGMSFAKLLQNVFYLEGVLGPRQTCAHSLYHDYLRFFFRGDFLVTLEFERCTPLKLNVLDHLDLNDSTWYDGYTKNLVEEFVSTVAEVQRNFELTSVKSVVDKKCDELLKCSFEYPSDVNGVLRDLFVSCTLWNSHLTSSTSPILPPSPSPKPTTPTIRSQSADSFKQTSYRFAQSEPRLKRRPSLQEIQVGRTKVLGEPLDLNDVSFMSRDSLEEDILSPRTERRSFTLSNAQSAPSALNNLAMKPIPLPQRLVDGHLLLPSGRRLGNSVVPVKENEPTSWIAHTLNSNEYSIKLMNSIDISKNWEKILLDGAFDLEQDSIYCGFTDASEYSPRQCTFSVRCFYAKQFHALRMLYMTRENKLAKEEEFFEKRFIESLSRCYQYRPTGGKSKAMFLKTLDDRFIVKSITQEEFEMFQILAPRYFAHLGKVFGSEGKPSMLVPILGVFSLSMQSEVVVSKRYVNSGQVIQNKLLVIISPNMFWKIQPDVVYDLKGNHAKSRFIRNPEPTSVKLDMNFFQDNDGVPLSLYPSSKNSLSQAVSNDASFLASVDVVDYSLLVGVKKTQIIAGIIDYLQLYNYKKMFESHVKKAAGQAEPTVISPKKYQARFVLSTERYFISTGDELLQPNSEA